MQRFHISSNIEIMHRDHFVNEVSRFKSGDGSADVAAELTAPKLQYGMKSFGSA